MRENIRKSVKRLFYIDQKKNKGSTMLEVLVGFSVLMILNAGFLKILAVSNNMYFRGVDIIKEQQTFVEELYKTNPKELTKTELKDCTPVLQEVDKTGKNKTLQITLDAEDKVICYTDEAFVKNNERPMQVYRIEK